MNNPLITILGPTATGKTKLAALLADRINAEIISADSRQVYCRMDIGTGKDLADYCIGEKTIPYYLIDIVAPGTEYNVFQYQQAAVKIIRDIQLRNKNRILCGGSGMYIEALLKGYKLFPVPQNEALRKELETKSDDELEACLAGFRKLHNKTDTENRSRLLRALEIEFYYQEHPDLQEISHPITSIIFGLRGNRDLIRKRITERLEERLSNGMIGEVEQLIADGTDPKQLIRYGLEYKFITLYILGEIDYETMFSRLNISIHQFSKRQMTWFRKMEREGFHIHWLDINLPDQDKLSLIEQTVKKNLKT